MPFCNCCSFASAAFTVAISLSALLSTSAIICLEICSLATFASCAFLIEISDAASATDARLALYCPKAGRACFNSITPKPPNTAVRAVGLEASNPTSGPNTLLSTSKPC